jgi:hypothetical protein
MVKTTNVYSTAFLEQLINILEDLMLKKALPLGLIFMLLAAPIINHLSQ